MYKLAEHVANETEVHYSKKNWVMFLKEEKLLNVLGIQRQK